MEPVKAEPVNAAPPRQRNHGLDLLRILSISGVVAIHVFGLRVGAEPKGDRSWWIATALDIGFIWVVPVFIMISGALLLGSSQLHADPAGFYRKRGLRIIPALIAWNLIYLVGVRIWMRDEVLSAGRILQLLYDSSVFTQLYFLWIIVGLYAVAPLLAAFLRQGGPNRASVMAGVLVSAVAASSPARSPTSMRRTSSSVSREESRSRFADAIAQANGFPMNVGPCISPPASPALTPSATSRVHSTAASER